MFDQIGAVGMKYLVKYLNHFNIPPQSTLKTSCFAIPVSLSASSNILLITVLNFESAAFVSCSSSTTICIKKRYVRK
jgi:hypothetical protein